MFTTGTSGTIFTRTTTPINPKKLCIQRVLPENVRNARQMIVAEVLLEELGHIANHVKLHMQRNGMKRVVLL
jgi:hypothetical protein